MSIASVSLDQVASSARIAAHTQWGQLERLRMDVSQLEVHSLDAVAAHALDTCGVVASDAGLASLALAPFHLELLHVTDHRGQVHLTEFFPLTTLSADLESIFERTEVLRKFAAHLGLNWRDLTDHWERSDSKQPPMPRDVRMVADALREIAEWAVAAELACEPLPEGATGRVRRLVLHDGTLRSFLLRPGVIGQRLSAWWRDVAWDDSGVAIVGVSKRSDVWQRLALALSLDARVKACAHCYVVIPPELEVAVTRRSFDSRLGFGRLVLVRTRPGAPGQFLPVDLPEWILQDKEDTADVLAQIIRVSQGTFPELGYPEPLGQAHDAAHLTEFDAKVLRDMLVRALRDVAPPEELEPLLRFWSFSPNKWRKIGRIGQE